MPPQDLLTVVKQSDYPLDAFVFVQRGLDFTVRRTHGELPEEPDDAHEPATRHVSGPQLCEGMRDFAIEEYGLLARTVLKRWRINSCEDFGHIVFAMVDGGLMHKTDDDDIHDFIGCFSFASAFGEPLSLTENGS